MSKRAIAVYASENVLKLATYAAINGLNDSPLSAQSEHREFMKDS